MKILLITPLYPGYLEQSKLDATYAVHYVAREWTRDHDIRVIRPWPYYPRILSAFIGSEIMHRFSIKDQFTLDDVKVFRAPILKIPKIDYGNYAIRSVAEQFMEIFGQNEGPDVIICDNINPSIYIGEIIANKYGSVLIASLHNTDIKYLSNRSGYRKYMKIDDRVSKIVFRSEAIRQRFTDLYDGNKNETDYFTSLFGINKSDIMSQDKIDHKIISSNKTIVVASSLTKLKKVDVLIDAFVRIKNKNGYILKIIGDGPEQKRLKRRVNSLKAEDYVYFEGAKTREEVLCLMEQSDIFALVSSPETFGLVYIEAMAKGCITIGSKGEGIDGVIVDNENGFLCRPGDTQDLQSVLKRAMNLSSCERERLINNALVTASSLSYESLANEFIKELKNE